MASSRSSLTGARLRERSALLRKEPDGGESEGSEDCAERLSRLSAELRAANSRPRSVLIRGGTAGSSLGLTSISSRAIKAIRPAEFSPTSIYLFLPFFVRRFYGETDFFLGCLDDPT